MATPSDRLAKVILRYEVDRASAQSAANSAKELSASLKGVGLAVDTVAAQADHLRASFGRIARGAELDKLAAQMSLASQSGVPLNDIINKTSADLARLGATAAEVDRVANAFDRAEKEAREFAAAADSSASATRTGGRGVFGNSQRGTLGALGQQIFLLPDVGPSTEISRGLILIDAAQQAMERFNVSLTKVVAVAGLVGGAVVAVALAFDALNRQLQDAKRTLDAALGANETYYDALARLSTRQVQEEVERLNRLIPIQRQQAQALRETAENAFAGLLDAFTEDGQAPDAISQASARIAFAAVPGFQELEQSALEAEAALAESEHTLNRFTEGLRINAFAVGDAAQATEQRLATARTVGDDFTTLSNALAGSSDQARALIDRLETQAQAAELSADALRQSGDTSLEASDAINAYNAEAEHARDVAGRLLNIILPVIEAREAEIALIERQIDLINSRVDLEVEAFNTLQSGTVESVDARIASLNAEAASISRAIPAMERQAQTSDEWREALEAAQSRLYEVNRELNVLATIRPDVAARQFREESEKLAAQLVKDIHRIEAARDSRIAEIEANLGEKEVELARRRSDDVTEAEEKAAARRLDALEEFREAEARIHRKFNRDFLNAVGERDALAAFQAKQQRDDDLADAKARLDKQRATVDKSLREQQQTIEKRYADQLQTARENARRQIQLERDKATAEISLRVAAYTAEIQGLQQSLFAQFALNQQFWAANIALAQRAVGQVLAQTDAPPRQILIPQTVQLTGGTPYERFAAYQRDQGVPGFAGGLWDVPYDNMLARLHRGEMVVPQRQAQVIRERGGAMGGVPTTIRLKLDGPATTRLMEGKAVDVYVAIEGGR